MTPTGPTPHVAILDYGVGNLRSIRFACESVGLRAAIASCAADVYAADAVILPGVGAFAAAMTALRDQGLDEAIIEYATTGRPLLGICLGMQLLMDESEEFGRCRGLGLVPGRVVALPRVNGTGDQIRVPHLGWGRLRETGAASGERRLRDAGAADFELGLNGAGATQVEPGSRGAAACPDRWRGTMLDGIREGTSMYFAHSFVVVPDDRDAVLSHSDHGGIAFTAAIETNNIAAFQFHPERSGPAGLRIYRNLAQRLNCGADDQRQGRLACDPAAETAAPHQNRADETGATATEAIDAAQCA